MSWLSGFLLRQTMMENCRSVSCISLTYILLPISASSQIYNLLCRKSIEYIFALLSTNEGFEVSSQKMKAQSLSVNGSRTPIFQIASLLLLSRLQSYSMKPSEFLTIFFRYKSCILFLSATSTRMKTINYQIILFK